MLNKLGFFLFTFTIGLISLARTQKKPCDKSNRFNKAILFWFVFTRYKMVNAELYKTGKETISQWDMIKKAFSDEAYFVEAFPWLRYDLWEILMVKFKP
jgi:hypothetical protein